MIVVDNLGSLANVKFQTADHDINGLINPHSEAIIYNLPT